MSHLPLSRRQLLKVLAAAAGTAVLSSVPNKWKTPVVDIGALPAHAQLSGAGSISGTVFFARPVAPVSSSGNSPEVLDHPAPGAVVNVVGLGLSSNTTDSSGAFTINNVPAGIRSIIAGISGLPGCTSLAVTVSVSMGVNTTQNIFLGCGQPVCLSSDAMIDTPSGAVRVTDIQAGMPVWTLDATGLRVRSVVAQTVRRPVLPGASIVHLALSDGRQVQVSAGHPTTDGRMIGDLTAGDVLDGARVVKAEVEAYEQPAKYDLLPAGETGSYWANGIPMNSTIEVKERRIPTHA